MSSKLGPLGMYNRPRTLSPIINNVNDEKVVRETSSARVSSFEKEIKNLKAENAKMKSDLKEVRTALKQLISETSHEKLDERRINLLKLQMIQLERQIAVMSDALGSRQVAVIEAENVLARLAEKLRSYIAAVVKGPMVSISRSDLTSLVEMSESARIKLSKATENSSKDVLGKELLFLNPFLGGKHKMGESLTLLDIALGRMDYINLRHVAQLESKLCQLYKELIRVQEHLHDVKYPALFTSHSCPAHRQRVETVLLKSCALIQDTADDLLALSLLCPSAPWPALKRPITKEIPVERVLAALPQLPRTKQEEVRHVIQSSIQICKYHQVLLESENTALKGEIAFHRSVYDLQVQYIQTLFDAVRQGYGEFENSVKQVICKPIEHLLDAYKCLLSTTSDDALRNFLIIMKENEQQLSSTVEMFSSLDFDKDENGSAVFSKFGEEFLGKLNSLVSKCQKERDAALKQRQEVKEEQTHLDLELRHVIEELEAKYEKEWIPKHTDVTSLDVKFVLEDRNTLGCNEKESSDKLNEITDDFSKYVEICRPTSDYGKKQAKQMKDDPTVLRSFLYDEASVGTDHLQNKSGKQNQKGRANLRKEWDNNFVQSAMPAENSVLCLSGSTKQRHWKPDKEWISDFSGLLENAQISADTIPGSLEHKSTLELNTSQDKSGRPPVLLKKNVIKSKKPALQYEPHLQVAIRNLSLKSAEGQSNISKDSVSGSNTN